ncbi:Thiol peroxidase [Candidatus Magnetaquicoccaceae bacterium FCR-1]|uniref:Thiol peroxidase n=1 Tax=Candidatus Magnetaquiglobus chichijimensis TaxID=3141448 RepID=A0ABQ0C8G1_9PROT
MAQIAFKGNPIHTCGQLPAVGSQAPDFKLTGTDLADVTLATFAGKRVILNIFPSVDTAVCAMSVRRFNAEASNLDNTVVLCVSLDLPFAHKRFCGAEGLSAVHAVSEMRARGFGEAYGVRMVDGPLAGLLARAVVIIDAAGKVVYTQQVPEIVEEPNYEQVLAALA